MNLLKYISISLYLMYQYYADKWHQDTRIKLLLLPIIMPTFMLYALLYIVLYLLKVIHPHMEWFKSFFENMYVQERYEVKSNKKTCLIYVSKADYNGYIHSLLGVAFIHDLKKQLGLEYNVEVVCDENAALLKEATPDLVVVYAHGGIYSRDAMLGKIIENNSENAPQVILWGCDSFKRFLNLVEYTEIIYDTVPDTNKMLSGTWIITSKGRVNIQEKASSFKPHNSKHFCARGIVYPGGHISLGEKGIESVDFCTLS